MPQALDPTRPGDRPPVPVDRDALLIEAIRTACRMGEALNAIRSELDAIGEDPRLEKAFEITLRRHSDCSALHLLIAAENIGINLPDDLRDYQECEGCGEEIKDGDRVYGNVDGGYLHERCCGGAGFVDENQEPLPADAPRPDPIVYRRR